MNGFLLFVSFILLSDLIEIIYGQNLNECHDLSQCVSKLKELTNDENMAFAYDEDHLEELCAKLRVGVECVNAYMKRCLDQSSQLQYEAMTNGTQRLIKDLCTKNSPFRTEYLKHAECYNRNQKEYLSCSDKYYADSYNYQNENQSTQIRRWCCNFDGHRSCTYDAVLQKCGKEAALLAQNIVITGGGLLVELHCGNNYTHNSPLCSYGLSNNSLTHWSHVSLIVSFLIFLSNVWT